jgi:energy-coupling factor transporter ATP-binding protein EcfA2
MIIGPGETPIFKWRAVTYSDFIIDLLRPISKPEKRPLIIAIDGRSGSGKSTLARRLQSQISNTAVIHTDDVAWHHSFFDWQQLMIDGILALLARGTEVAFRPPAWRQRQRPGAIRVPVACQVLFVEGVGASRSELQPWLDAAIWIQSDMVEAERRGLERDGGSTDAKAFWDEWMAAEITFLQAQRPWTRASAIVNGTPPQNHDPEAQLLVASV